MTLVNSDKLAAGLVTSLELNKTAITGQIELSEGMTLILRLIFDTSSSTLKKVLSNLKTICSNISISLTTVNDTSEQILLLLSQVQVLLQVHLN